MDITAILQSPPETLVPVGWVRDHLLPEPNPELVRFLLSIEVAGAYWAGVIRGEIAAPLAGAGRLAHGEFKEHQQPSRNMPKWREKYGEKGRSRVTVFTRPDESPYVYIEWWSDGKRKVRRLDIQGVPVTNPRVARLVALVAVNRLEASYTEDFWKAMPSLPEISADVSRILGIPEDRDRPVAPAASQPGTASGTVGELFSRWYSMQEANLKKKSIARRHWEEAFDSETVVAGLRPADVNETIKLVAKKKEWSVKTIANYASILVMAFTYARDQLQWKGPAPDLIKVPKVKIPDTGALTYEESEYQDLLDVVLRVITRMKTEQLDRIERRNVDTCLLAGGALSICGTIARRVEQVISTEVGSVERRKLVVEDNEINVLEFRFPLTSEKAERFQDADFTVAWISDLEHPKEYMILTALLDTKAVQESGLLFPSLPRIRSLDDSLPSASIAQNTIRRYLRQVETEAGVPSIKNRGFHGLKRLAATRCKTEEELELVALVSNTSMTMLERYHKKLGTFKNDHTRRTQLNSIRRQMGNGTETPAAP